VDIKESTSTAEGDLDTRRARVGTHEKDKFHATETVTGTVEAVVVYVQMQVCVTRNITRAGDSAIERQTRRRMSGSSNCSMDQRSRDRELYSTGSRLL
jgi:hypothetical protein